MKQTEIGMIPDDWEVKKIGELYSVHNGLSKDASFFGKGNPFLSFSTVFNNIFIPEKLDKKVMSSKNEQKSFSIHKGDVFITRTSETVDELGMSSVSLKDYPKATFNGFCKRLRLIEEGHVVNKYIGYFLRSSLIRNRILKYSTVTTRASLKNEELLNLPLIFPPTLAEQQKIAKALSDVDNVISTLEKLITKKKNLKQGTMQQLLTGKKRLPGFSPTVVEPVETTKFKQTEIGEIPEDWEVKELGEICMNFSYGVGAEAKKFDGNIKYIRITDIDESSHLFSPQPITSPSFYTSKSFVKENDLLFARTGASVGKSYIYSVNDGKLVFAGFLMRCNVSNADSKFIFYNTLTTRYDTWVTSESMRSGQPGLNLEQLKKFLVPIPSKLEQTAIANELSSMDKEIEALNTKLEKYRNLKTGMMQQLLTGKIRLKS